MTKTDWEKIRCFLPYEFDDPTVPGSGVKMAFSFVSKLDSIRASLGYPLQIHSGIRTEEHNKEVGGVDGSAHVKGFAADIGARTSRERFNLIQTALRFGIKRIGIGKTFIHLDDDPALPQSVLWLYN